MTGLAGLRARAWSAVNLTEGQARNVVSTVALVIAALLTGLFWGIKGVLCVVVLEQVFLLWHRSAIEGRVDEGREEASVAHGKADEALSTVREVAAALDDTDEPSNGKHARSTAPTSPRNEP